MSGKPSNWDESFHLALANELSGSRLWRGSYRLVAVYSNTAYNLNVDLGHVEAYAELAEIIVDRMGVLEPLRPLSDKWLIMRNVDQVRCDESGINAHFDGASGAFTAEPPDDEAKAGGPSIDQVIRRELSGVFHAISAAGGRFKTGQILDVGAEGLDVYNTMLDAMDVPGRLGPAKRDASAIDMIRV